MVNLYANYTRRVLADRVTGMDRYLQVLQTLVPSDSKVLHFGCGRDLSGIHRRFSDRWRIFGADIDQHALADYPGEAVAILNDRIDAADRYFDVVICEYVLEHLVDPEATFREIGRVLSPSGLFVALAPNKWSYKSLAASMVPNRFHNVFVQFLRQDNTRKSVDVYPTVYRANTKKDIERLCGGAGMDVVTYEMVDNGPTWFARLPVMFELGRVWHFFQARYFTSLACNFVVVAQKRR